MEDVVVEWVDDGRSGAASCGFVEWRMMDHVFVGWVCDD